jgi:hypothetical protein
MLRYKEETTYDDRGYKTVLDETCLNMEDKR